MNPEGSKVDRNPEGSKVDRNPEGSKVDRSCEGDPVPDHDPPPIKLPRFRFDCH